MKIPVPVSALIVSALVLAATAASAQEPVAPTSASTGSVRGQNLDGYNITNQFELGYRYHSVGGDLGRYRSDINYGNGIRLLGSSLTIHSREGRGKYFDEVVLNTQGLGDDPYQSATFRVQKNRLYRYDLLWRSIDYYNPALPISFGQHFLDTTRHLQDHDFTLFPQSAIRFFAGYSRSTQRGPALTTVQEFGPRNDEFPLFADIDRLRNEYRVGGEVLVSGWKFNWLRGWDNYTENVPSRLAGPQGYDPQDLVTLSSFQRSEPYSGSSPYWRLNLHGEKQQWAVNARFTNTSGRRAFVFDESATGTSRFGTAQNRQIVVGGDARRPVTGGHLTLSLFPASKLTVTNHTSYHNLRMEGDSTYREVNNATSFGDLLYFRLLGIRTIANVTDAQLRATDWLGFRGGYSYSVRRIRSREQVGFGEDLPELVSSEQENRLHQGSAGVRIAPSSRLQFILDGELGRADKPFYPTADRNYHALSARIQYRTRTLSFGAHTRTFYNTNSTSLFAHSSRSRNYAADASWSPKAWLGVDASYTRLHLDTATGIAYFAAARLVENDRSFYTSNIHAAHAGVRLSIRSRADLWLGYSRTQDTGGGNPGGVSLDTFRTAQVFPLTFESPVARVSVKLLDKVRWNFGYQHYRYKEDFDFRRSYRAHTGYTSVLWSF